MKLLPLCFYLLCGTFVTFANAQVPQIINWKIRDARQLGLSDYGTNFKGETNQNWNLWRNWLQTSSDEIIDLQRLLADPNWWRSWVQLPSLIREKAISTFLPLLIEHDEFSLHCSDAFKFCMTDKNCKWKYWNFINSCSSEKIPMEDWASISFLDKILFSGSTRTRRSVQSMESATPGRGNRKYRNRKLRRRKKRRKIKNRNHLNRRIERNLRQATEKMHYWMSEYWPNIYDNPEDKQECSGKCLNALLMLNRTVYSGLFAKCECSAQSIQSSNTNSTVEEMWDESKCRSDQQKAYSCRPRLFKPRNAVIGCTESRVRCENNPRCLSAQKKFLRDCSQVISGDTCSKNCKKAIDELANASRYFNTCVCDGTERWVCLGIREHIKTLCSVEKNCSESGKTRQKRGLINKYDPSCETSKTKRRTKRSLTYYPNHSSAHCSVPLTFYIFVLSLFVLLLHWL